MTQFGHIIRFGCCALVLGALAPSRASAQKGAPNVLEVVVANGPFAGTYKAPGDEVVCMHVRKQPQFTASYRDLTPTANTVLGEAGIDISNPDAAGAKQGRVRISFGNPDKKPTVYEVIVPGSGSGPLTMSRSGARGELGFAGKTKDGIQLRVTAKCLDIEEM
jgi:hypothetical protein